MAVIAWTFDPLSDAQRRPTSDRSVWDYVPEVVRSLLALSDDYRIWRWARGESSLTTVDRRRNQLATMTANAVRAQCHRTGRQTDEPTLNSASLGFEIDLLDPTELAIVLFAAQVAGSAAHVNEHNIESLRSIGLADVQIFDIALAAAASSFFADAADEVTTPARLRQATSA
jgi:hypothetical protein